MKEEYPVFVKWESIVDWVLDRCEKFPKNARFTVSNRIANFTLDVLGLIIDAIYTRKKRPLLDSINLIIEKLRVLFRISHKRKFLSVSQYEFITRELNEAGRMIGGWRRGLK
ncbi:MAG: diversity-generating retroelement protein Avd [Planctomycetes bacterium]|nr:diversity-generating retroelement protein Avd [Planctomycetota bacterium]